MHLAVLVLVWLQARHALGSAPLHVIWNFPILHWCPADDELQTLTASGFFRLRQPRDSDSAEHPILGFNRQNGCALHSSVRTRVTEGCCRQGCIQASAMAAYVACISSYRACACVCSSLDGGTPRAVPAGICHTPTSTSVGLKIESSR